MKHKSTPSRLKSAEQSFELIIEMMRSTGLREFLDRLESDQEVSQFTNEVLAGVRAAYPARANGRVLFPFKRLFFIAYV